MNSILKCLRQKIQKPSQNEVPAYAIDVEDEVLEPTVTDKTMDPLTKFRALHGPTLV